IPAPKGDQLYGNLCESHQVNRRAGASLFDLHSKRECRRLVHSTSRIGPVYQRSRIIGCTKLVISGLATLTIAPSRAQTDSAAKPLRDFNRRHGEVDAETRRRVARGEYERLER